MNSMIDAERMTAYISDQAEIMAIKAALAQPACIHDETERLGAIWTHCTQCGKKWADDEQPASKAYDLIDRFLRHSLHDDDYAEYSAALESVRLGAAQPALQEQEPQLESDEPDGPTPIMLEAHKKHAAWIRASPVQPVLAQPVQPASERPLITAMIEERRALYELDMSCTPAFLHWLDTQARREGVAANEAWNAGYACAGQALAQPVESYELVAAANGFYGGRPCVQLLNPALVLPQGVALYMRTDTPLAIKETT